jgi:hypothetical protein
MELPMKDDYSEFIERIMGCFHSGKEMVFRLREVVRVKLVEKVRIKS